MKWRLLHAKVKAKNKCLAVKSAEILVLIQKVPEMQTSLTDVIPKRVLGMNSVGMFQVLRWILMLQTQYVLELLKAAMEEEALQ